MTTSKSMPTTAPEATIANPAPLIDHTLLRPEATADQIRLLCDEAVEWGFFAVCVPPCYARLAADCLYGSAVGVASVVGFPCGYDSSASKIRQTEELVVDGCSEIDMVIRIGQAICGDFGAVEEEIAQVVIAAPAAKVKVIIECCFLGREQKVALTECVVRAGAAYVKTSTGFGSAGATEEDVRLLASTAAGRIGVKAAGGIRSLAELTAMHAAGATRIGTSSGVAIMNAWGSACRTHDHV